MCQIAIIEAFVGLEDPRRHVGQRHTLPMCLALFTLAIAAGNRGFSAIGDWITSYREQLIDLLKPPKNRLPSYSTVPRALLYIPEFDVIKSLKTKQSKRLSNTRSVSSMSTSFDK